MIRAGQRAVGCDVKHRERTVHALRRCEHEVTLPEDVDHLHVGRVHDADAVLRPCGIRKNRVPAVVTKLVTPSSPASPAMTICAPPTVAVVTDVTCARWVSSSSDSTVMPDSAPDPPRTAKPNAPEASAKATLSIPTEMSVIRPRSEPRPE